MIVMVMVPGGKLITTVMSMITNGKREESEDHGTCSGAGTTPKGSLRTPHPIPRIGWGVPTHMDDVHGIQMNQDHRRGGPLL